VRFIAFFSDRIFRPGGKEKGMKMKKVIPVIIVSTMGLAFSLSGCALMETKKPSALVPTGQDTMAIYKGKYEFEAPAGWALLQNVEGGDFELGFWNIEKGDFPSQTTFIYDDEPFGSSRDLEERAKQYCTRFLFNSGISAQVQKEEKTQVLGRPALALYMGEENPNRNEKVKSKIYLLKKGDRIISFVCTQWRPLNGTFSPEPFQLFEKFVHSFKFLKKDFYENFEEELKKAGL
jgi:hypothetical protein